MKKVLLATTILILSYIAAKKLHKVYKRATDFSDLDFTFE